MSEWRDLWLIPDLRILAITGSTNDVLRELAEHGAAEFTAVIAEEQTAGRGQHGRAWHGTPLKSLHLSVLLRPHDLSCLTATPIRVGMATAFALRTVTGLQVGLKWPNDLQVNGRKLGGILCESVSGAAPYIIVGIGVNVLQAADDFPRDLGASATSIRAEGSPADRAAVAGAIISALRAAAARIASPFDEEEASQFGQLDVLRGQPIQHDGKPAGTAAGLSASGALRVFQNGAVHEIRSGTVRRAD
ncbi:MAG TPA: biotin--[acetyl-CoA-carboxylase] ligase [Longimicrobiales bacterium]|nr:biotin--[acetyl-CoA-carboxylase] ligase [Longimicrobiales bacterium]